MLAGSIRPLMLRQLGSRNKIILQVRCLVTKTVGFFVINFVRGQWKLAPIAVKSRSSGCSQLKFYLIAVDFLEVKRSSHRFNRSGQLFC